MDDIEVTGNYGLKYKLINYEVHYFNGTRWIPLMRDSEQKRYLNYYKIEIMLYNKYFDTILKEIK